jgi:hypothetical protein
VPTRTSKPGGLVKIVAPSTIWAGIDRVYGTKEQERRSEWPEKGQGKEGCTKNGTVGWRREKIDRSCRVGLLAEHAVMHGSRTNWLPQRPFCVRVCVTVALQIAVGTLVQRKRLPRARGLRERCQKRKNVWADLVSPAESAHAAPPCAQYATSESPALPNLAAVRVPGNLKGCTPRQAIRVRPCLFTPMQVLRREDGLSRI